MLGSLARWLRFLGYNSLYCDTESDEEILERIHHRILLSRDKELLEQAKKRGHTVVNPGLKPIRSMLQTLQEELGIRFSADPHHSRCAMCNSLLKEAIREEVQEQIPKASLQRHDQFWQCTNPNCRKVYWQGRHWTRIQNTLKQLNSPDTSQM